MDKIPIYSTFDLRRHAVEAVQRGLSQSEVAENYGIDRTTLYRWLQRFKHDGIEGLMRMPVSGRPRKMPDIDDLLKKIVLKSALDFASFSVSGIGPLDHTSIASSCHEATPKRYFGCNDSPPTDRGRIDLS